MAKVSFIMPAYKRRFLKEAIDSILSQTCRDFELVIVDDKSPENLFEIIESFGWYKPSKDNSWVVEGVPVRYYQNEQNIGGKDLVAAWHKALEYATADWCVLPGDDDVYLPRFVECMLQLQSKYPQCDVMHTRAFTINAEGQRTALSEPMPEYETQTSFAYNRAVRRFAMRAPDFMFRKSALLASGGFVDFPVAWYSDDATWAKLAKHGIACTQQALFCFRDSGINLSTSNRKVHEKIVAAEQYKEWMRKFVDGLDPKTDEDVFLRDNMLGGVVAKIHNLAQREMQTVPLGEWFKCYRLISGTRQEKNAFIYDRFPLIALIRRWLSKLGI